MKEYIKNNWKPLLIGYSVAITLHSLLGMLDDIIIKIAILLTK